MSGAMEVRQGMEMHMSMGRQLLGGLVRLNSGSTQVEQ